MQLENLSGFNKDSYYKQKEFIKIKNDIKLILVKKGYSKNIDIKSQEIAEKFIYSFGYSIINPDYKKKLEIIINKML